MAEFNGTRVTTAGLQLLAKALAGDELHFTRVALGDGTLAQGQQLASLTNLINWKLDLPITGIVVAGTGTASMTAVLQNASLTSGFFAREIGVYATDPDDGEILYAVANAGNNCDYIPAGGGSDVVELILQVITVVDQAETVTANIDNSLLWATQIDLNTHIASTNPHENFLQWGTAVTTCNDVIVRQTDPKVIRPIPFDTFKVLILGGDGTDLAQLRKRLSQTERETANIALQMEAESIYPDYNALLAEDFKIPDLVDMFCCEITSIVSGDDSIDVSTLRGIVPGAWYTISDGVYQERCQIKSVVKNGTTYRLIMMDEIQNTYLSGSTSLYRTTAEIVSVAGMAEGAGDRRTALWQPPTTWTGVNASAAVSVSLVTTAANAGAFTASGAIGYTADGAVTLV